MSQAKKHVIFLGAGASASSGYPVANGLRLLISSEKHFREALEKALPPDSPDHNARLKRDRIDDAARFFETMRGTINLFRNGGFASVDEFCKLSSGYPNFSDHAEKMRVLTRSVLSILNPEEAFENSEYYPFIQSLFKENLFELRDDISILSFNYDPYLEYLLLRALEQRREVAGEERDKNLENAVTSGFCHIRDTEWLRLDKSGHDKFCLLKLHGVLCAARNPDEINHNVLFTVPARDRIKILFDSGHRREEVPLVFPWELIRNDLKFVSKEDFPLSRVAADYFPLFKHIWMRACREIKRADKISFVGLSMHPFLDFGLRYLFAKKTGAVQFVVVNPDNVTRESHGQASFDPITPAGRVRSFLASTGAHWEPPKGVNRSHFDECPQPNVSVGCSIRSLKTFQQFINEEMR